MQTQFENNLTPAVIILVIPTFYKEKFCADFKVFLNKNSRYEILGYISKARVNFANQLTSKIY